MRRKTHEEFVKEVYHEVGDEYTVISDYKGSNKRVSIRHNICGHEWSPNANNFLKKGNRCPNCANKSRSKKLRHSKDEFINKFDEFISGEYTLIGEYKGERDRIELIHNECGNRYRVYAKNFSRGDRCYKCSVGQSKGELMIEEVLKSLSIRFKSQYTFPDCVNSRKLPFDFAIFNEDNVLSFLIEYQGIQHYEERDFFGGKESFDKTVENDRIKYNYCISNNIKLVRIPYWEFNNIDSIITNEINNSI